jgi:ribosomal protein S18 acetylase RimI-like enzyme
MRIIPNPKPEHLSQINTWLYDEYMKNINGFYGNYDTIKDAFLRKNLICIIEKNNVIGFLVYKIFERTAELTIANIKHEYKKKGYGSKLLNHLENKLIKKKVIAIDLICSPASSKKVWKKLGFKELKEVEENQFLKNSNSPYLYKILIESEKPTKSKVIKQTYIELYCKDPINKESKPNYKWKIYPKLISQKPIIYPVDSEWSIKLFQNGVEISENRIKRFQRGEFLNRNFLIIDKVPEIKSFKPKNGLFF